MKIPFFVWLLQGIPECIGGAAFVASLGFKRLPPWKKIIIAGIIQAVFIYIIRILPLTPYTHTFLGIPALAVTVSLLYGLDIRRAHLFAVLSILHIAVFEGIFNHLFDALKIISFEEIAAGTFKRIIGGTPHVFMLFITAWLVNRKKNGAALINWELLKKSSKLIMNPSIMIWRR